ncbi:MAG: serine/threonine-protein kinase [Myxococcota bacterium]
MRNDGAKGLSGDRVEDSTVCEGTIDALAIRSGLFGPSLRKLSLQSGGVEEFSEGEVIHLGDSDGSAVDNEAESLRIDEATLGGALDNALNHALARLPPVPPRTSRSREARIGPVPLGFGDPTSWLGSKLGPYELTSFLGEGSTARAYEAKHSLLGVERIIKLPARGADANTILAEARLLERLAHPGVAPFVEYDVDKGTPFAVFRHRRGHSLSERLAMGEALSESELLKLAIDVCDVLEFCHSHSILHLDLKPANLFVTGERTVVLDFGIAAVREDSARKTHFYGTPQFAAPEQVVAPEAVDTRTDLYGLGMTLYAAAAGNLQNTHSGEGLFGHLFGSLRPLGELRSDLGESFTGLVSDLLKPIPGERPENATEVRHRLSKLIENTQQENQ